MEPAACPECGALWSDGQTCQEHFYQMLYWENEHPGHGVVHHLMVICYHLQHPSLLSPDGLSAMRRLLGDFLGGADPQVVRRQKRAAVDSGRRDWKIKASPASQGAYARPVAWTMRAGDVVAAGPARYVESVRAWAAAAAASLNELP